MIEKIESSNSNCNTRGVNGGSGDDTSVWCQHHHHHPTVLARYAGGGGGGTLVPVSSNIPPPPSSPNIFPRPALTSLTYII